ncbi:hypothetical protein GQ55_2G461000 [Panicum hallii var. hallii]|uniref:Bifunctional inhibitor/plant lipid transfer protein/seed storage helical domain-containing protein n=1 Tax=Panicum hallii var. hallii TaxID=1504633 RepID=A0A2T7EZL8_9POAL|nr:hypothetical protein GQ55_2G461000 [Panicum hallii var. hallii]
MAAPPAVSFLAIAVALMAVLHPAATNPPPPPPPTPSATGTPTTCDSTLYRLLSCEPFLSTGSLAGPPASCCGPLRAVLTSSESICLCHLIGGEVNQFAHINIDPVRLALLPLMCLAIIPPELPYMCFVGPVPPIRTSPAPAATLPRAALKHSVAGRG